MMRGKQIDPAELDRQVLIKTRTVTPDSRGDIGTPTLTTLATVWARRSDLRSYERFQAGRAVSVRVASFVVRYRSDVTEKMIIVDGSETFEIVGIAEIGRKDWLDLAAEGVA